MLDYMALTEELLTARNPNDDRKAFRRMLETYVPMAGYDAPPRLRILNLGCGVCYEAPVLTEYFEGDPETAHHTGIDRDAHKIDAARRELNLYFIRRGKYVPRPDYEFICGDARNVSGMVNGKFGIVVARHPSVDGRQRIWRPVFEEAARVSDSPSLFIGTTYSDKEQEILRGMVEDLGYHVTVDELNPHAFLGGVNGETLFDRKVLLATK